MWPGCWEGIKHLKHLILLHMSTLMLLGWLDVLHHNNLAVCFQVFAALILDYQQLCPHQDGEWIV